MKLAGTTLSVILMAGLLSSCSPKAPEQIKLNSDACDFCKMTISDVRFAAELITNKGRIYKFDDLACMQNYKNEDPHAKESHCYISDFNNAGQFLEVEKAIYVQSEEVKSPMGGNTAAFADESSAKTYSEKIQTAPLTWDDVRK